MVRLVEYQGKELLKNAKIMVPRGKLSESPEKTREIAETIGGPVVIKAQIPITGRFKAGAVKFAQTPEEAAHITKELLDSEFKGYKVKKVLVEEKVDFTKEFYLGIIINYSYKSRSPLMIFSSKGGVDIEEIAKKEPASITQLEIDVLQEPTIDDVKEKLLKPLVEDELASKLAVVAYNLYTKVFKGYDCTVAEVNPLVLTSKDELVALDCRITVDDSSLYRHPELTIETPRDINRPPTPLERSIWSWEDKDPRGTGYFVQLVTKIEEPGYVGFHGIGGGGAMLAADALMRRGLKIANYADTSGDPPASKVYRVIKTILSQPGIEGYILMGSVLASQEQWHHAHAIVKALRETLKDKPGFPVIILIAGNKEVESHEILRKGLKDLPIRLEIYGRDHVYNIDYIAERMKALVEEYRRERVGK